MSLFSIVYVSSARPGLRRPDLEAIASGAREFNGSRGITGMLLHDDGSFMQALEGEESLLQQLLSDGREDRPLFTRAAPSDPAVLFLRTHAETLRAIRTLNDPKGIYLTCPLRLERR